MNLLKSSILISLLLLNGCESSSSKDTEVKIKGTATLSKAIVCIDSNLDSTCNKDEIQTISNDKGEYNLTSSDIKDGDIILAQDGYNLVLLEENKAHLAVKESFRKDNQENNINTITTLIAGAMNDGLSYQETKEKIAKKRELDINFIELNPFSLLDDEVNKNLFLTIRAIEHNVLYPETKNKSSNLKKLENGNLVITEEEADEALLDFDIFSFDLNTFKENLNEFLAITLVRISDFFECTLDSSCVAGDYNFSLPIAQEPDFISEELVLKEDIKGVWFKESKEEESQCLDMGDNDTWKFYNKDGNSERIIFFKNFDLENRRINLRGGLPLSWISYLIYKSENVTNRFYISANVRDSIFDSNRINKNFTLNSFDTLENCIKELNKNEIKEDDYIVNKNKWDNFNINNYTFELTKSCFCPQEEVKEVTIEKGNIVSAKFIPSNTKIDLSKRGDIYSINGFFELIQDAFDSKASKVTVTYDETKGYPTNIYIDQNEMITDEEISYRVKNFKVLDEPQPTICTLEYTPICAKVVVECIMAPCEAIEQTFSNNCHLNANKRATFLHMGECE